jgi:hypothetical protein
LRVQTICPFCGHARTDTVRFIVNTQPLCMPLRCAEVARRGDSNFDYFSRPKPLKEMNPHNCGPCECDRLECLLGKEVKWVEVIKRA